VDAVWQLPAHQPPARGVHLLILLRRGWASAVGVLLPLHAVGILWAIVVAPVAALPHSGGDLHPLL
jgi:hypothetical protein